MFQSSSNVPNTLILPIQRVSSLFLKRFLICGTLFSISEIRNHDHFPSPKQLCLKFPNQYREFFNLMRQHNCQHQFFPLTALFTAFFIFMLRSVRCSLILFCDFVTSLHSLILKESKSVISHWLMTSYSTQFMKVRSQLIQLT